MLWKQDSDWVKKCMECKMEGSRSKRTWSGWCKKTVKHMNREDAVDRSCLSCWHICFGVVYSRKGRISRRHTAVTSLLNCYHQKRFCVLKMHRQQPLAGPTGSRQIIPLPYHQFLHTRLREFDSLDRSKWLPGIGCSTKDELGVVTTAGVWGWTPQPRPRQFKPCWWEANSVMRMLMVSDGNPTECACTFAHALSSNDDGQTDGRTERTNDSARTRGQR